MATQVPNRRLVRDASLSATKALPAAGANNTSGSFDLGSGPFRPDEIGIEIAVPALPNSTSTSDQITIQLYDSADNVTFLAVSPVVELVVPGVASTGSLAITATVKLPVNVREYIAFNQAASSGAGDNTGSSAVYSILL